MTQIQIALQIETLVEIVTYGVKTDGYGGGLRLFFV